MAIVPRKKISKAKSRQKHATWQKLQLQKLNKKYAVSSCKNCGADKLPHRVCPSCGYYNGKQVMTIKKKSKVEVLDA